MTLFDKTRILQAIRLAYERLPESIGLCKGVPKSTGLCKSVQESTRLG